MYGPAKSLSADYAEQMPDVCQQCEDWEAAVYEPFHWCHNIAFYQCTNGHVWNCGWAQRTTGYAPNRAGMPVRWA